MNQSRPEATRQGRQALPVLCLAIAASLSTSGCAVVTVAGATAGAVISVTGAVVSTTVGVAGKVVEKTIDAVTPDGDDSKK